MFRQEDSRKLYPDIDLSPLPPQKSKSGTMSQRFRRSYSSGMTLEDLSMQPMADSLPMQPTRRMTMAEHAQKKKKIRRRSFSNLEDASSTIPLPCAPELERSCDDTEREMQLRRQNSANSLRCLAMAAVPRRPSIVEQEQRQERRAARRRSQDNTGPRRRYKSVDDMSSRLRQHGDPEDMGRKVIRSARGDDSFSRRLPQRESGRQHQRRGRSREAATSRREQGIPGSIKVVRGQSCGGRIPCSIAIEPEQAKDGYRSRNASFGHSDPTDDESSTSSSLDDFDEESLGMVFGSVPVDNNVCNRTQVSCLTTDMCWQNGDGSVRSTASPENREALQRNLSEAMSSLTGSGSNLQKMQQLAQPIHPSLQHMQQQLDDSKRTDPTARMDCGASVYSAVSSGSQIQVNMLRPWICLCGEDNEAGFKFCGMCGSPERWTCTSCNFHRNKNRSPHCGGCGLRRAGGMGNNSTRSHRSSAPYARPIAA